jgi:hypothetical protein
MSARPGRVEAETGPVGQARATMGSPVRYGLAIAKECAFMTVGTILLIILILLLIGALPSWGYSRGWGYGPSGILGLVFVVVLILFLMGRL